MRAWRRACTWALPLLVWLTVLCLPSASAQQAFAGRYSNRAVAGDIALIGNVNYYCTTAAPATLAQATSCSSARAGTGSSTNSSTYLIQNDTDLDAATSNSSSATLGPVGSNVLFAGLYWSGFSASAAARSSVVFARPRGGSSSISAQSTAAIGSIYQSFADVTALVQTGGAGAYTVGNIASTAGNNWAAWTLVVAYADPALPTRNLAVFDGLQKATTGTAVDISVSGLTTPSTGTVNSVLGVVAYDGDRGRNEGAAAGGSLQFGADASSLKPVFNTANGVNDVFNSTITALGTDVTVGRTPAYTNTLGYDLDTFVPNIPLPNGSTTAALRVSASTTDVVYPGVITLATELFVPNIKDSLTKTVTDVNGGALVPGDTLEYQLTVKNIGNDGAASMVLSDVLPAGVTFVPGSLIVSGANVGGKTDAAGDDQAEYDGPSRTAIFRLGSGANSAAGGLIAPGSESRATFRATVNADVAGGTVIDNTGTVNYRQQTLGTPVTDTSDSDAATPGDQPARVTVAGPDLTLSKTHLGNASEGGTASFVLRVSNAGPAPSFGAVTVSDALPAGLSLVSAGGPGWSCTPSPLQCTRSDALPLGSSFPDVTVQVRAAPGSRGSLTNTASVASASEGSAQSGNNAASDVLTVQPPPSVALSKTVRNVSSGGAAGTSNTAQPKQLLEYCVTFRNSGGDAPDFSLQDDAPPGTTALADAYGAGLGVQLTLGSTAALTSVADSDAASLVAGRLSYAHGRLLLGQVGTVCFQVSVN